jgi:hypothetical protein
MGADEMSKIDGYECSASSFASMQYFHALFVLSSFFMYIIIIFVGPSLRYCVNLEFSFLIDTQ